MPDRQADTKESDMISTLLNNIATGSAQATPSTGSAGIDVFTALPAQAIQLVAGLFGAIGS